jgi:Trk K+ transport system NAD-binding subunit
VMGRLEEMIAHPLVGLKADEIAEMRQVQEVTAGAPVSRQVQRKARVGQARSVFFRVLRQAARSFRYALLLMLIIMLTGTIVFRFFYRNVDPLTGVSSNLDWFTALYFTVTIMSTTGFGDFNLATQDVPLKIFGIFMMLTGAGTVAILYSFLTNFLITLRLDEEVGRQVATEMENHVVMCGLGTIGYQMLKGLLERGQRVVVIEPQTDGRFNAEIKALGVPVIVGDARSPEIMRLVNIKKARCIAIMTSNDLTNLEIALGARQQRPDIRVVLRLFDRTLADRVERTFDIHIARSASAIAAPAFVAEVFDYQQLSSFYVENVPFTAAQETVTLGGDLNGLTIGEVCRRTGVTVLVHQERLAAVTLEKQHEGKSDFGELTLNFHPDDGTRLQEGDILVYVGPYDTSAEQ